ncbi:MAG: response regulator [Chthoniobacterales bacterium]|nr:response regulator [Chthoniobacterales bacterium]
MRALIADDDKSFAMTLSELVTSSGHEVVGVVFSGLDAIRAYKRHQPGVVLMDYKMERLNGLTACRNILSNDPSGRIVFLSGVADGEHFGRDTTGAVGFLQKPVKIAQLEALFATLESQHEK